jgi:hypothetical protein
MRLGWFVMLALEAGRDHWAAEEVLGASQVTCVLGYRQWRRTKQVELLAVS